MVEYISNLIKESRCNTYMFNRTYNKVINTKSKDYNYYWTKILIQYTWIPALVLLGCAFFIESHIYHGGDYDTLSFILFGISFILYVNSKFIPTYNFSNMINPSLRTEDISNELLNEIRNEKEKRIEATNICFKWLFWIIGFLIIGALGDNIKNFFNLTSFTKILTTIVIMIIMLPALFVPQILVYYVSKFGETIAYSLKLYFYSLIYKGLFVSKYALLTAAEEVVEEKLNERKHSSCH